MKKTLLKLFFLFSIVVSCQNNDLDKSKTLDEYYKLGIKNINENWTDLELEKNIEVLLKLKENEPNSMPKLLSEKSEKLFNKIFKELPTVYEKSPTNLKYFASQANLSGKLLGKLFNVYESNEGELYSNEEIEIYKYHIFVSTNKALTFLNFMSRIPANEKTKRKASIEKFQQGTVNSFIPVLDLIESENSFTKNNRVEISNYVSANLKKIWDLLNSKYQIQLFEKITEVINNCNNTKIELIFKELNNELKK